MKKFIILIPLIWIVTGLKVKAQEWQWSISVDSVISKETNANPRAFLWIPPECKQVRGVVVGQHNMLEEGILQHKDFRNKLASINFAEVWITPGLDLVFNFNKDTGENFNRMMKKLGQESGYTELEFAPVVPMGHSAAASYPWNFAAWNPERTLAILSVHGDAPLTNHTGSGQPNPNWDKRDIDGIPGLMVMGEYEWGDARLIPALKYKQAHPLAPISLLADAGHGHFDFSDALVNYLALFVTKAAKARLPLQMPLDAAPQLKPVNPKMGWLADRWRRDSVPKYPPAPYHKYQGDAKQALWYFDEEMADLTEEYYARARGKKDEYIGFTQNGLPLGYNPQTLARINYKFMPMTDGISFHLNATYTDVSRVIRTSEHAGSKISIDRICGPVVKINDTTFSIQFYRMGFGSLQRSGDIWLIAATNGDDTYKSTVQQINFRIPISNDNGDEQNIEFPLLSDIDRHTKTVTLNARSDKGLPIDYYVREGPAEVKGNQLNLTKIPPRSKYPVRITVVAWQYGKSFEPKIKSAVPVSRTFNIYK